MLVYLYDNEGYFSRAEECQIDPLESQKAGEIIFIRPSHSTDKLPLKPKEGFRVRYKSINDSWEYEPIPEPPKPQPIELTEKEKLYMELSSVERELRSLDYIGTKIATGRATIEQYKDKIARMNVLADQVEKLRDQIDQLEE